MTFSSFFVELMFMSQLVYTSGLDIFEILILIFVLHAPVFGRSFSVLFFEIVLLSCFVVDVVNEMHFVWGFSEANVLNHWNATDTFLFLVYNKRFTIAVSCVSIDDLYGCGWISHRSFFIHYMHNKNTIYYSFGFCVWMWENNNRIDSFHFR